MSETLYDSLKQTGRMLRKVALQPGQRVQSLDPSTGMIVERTEPLISAKPIVFEIHNLTGEEALLADSMITATPPAILQKQESPSGRGDVEALVGYDDQHPGYLAELRKEQPKKDALICLFGCPALMESTPGSDNEQKVKNLIDNLPGGLIGWLADQIDNLQVLTAVGNEAVTRFLSAGSVEASASNSTKRSRTNGKAKSTSKRTAKTSSSKKRKPRGGGGTRA